MYQRVEPNGGDLAVASWIDITLVYAVLFALLFNVQIGALTPLILIAVIAVYFVIRRNRLPSLILDTWPLLALPGFAILSVFWSIDAGITVKSSILYLLTILIALILGSGVRRADLMKAVFFAFLTFCGLSWLIGYPQIGTRAFQGLFASKNPMGEVGGALVLAAICVFSDAMSRGKRFLSAISVIGFVVGAATLWFSEATTATIATGTSALCTIVWLMTMRLDVQSRILLFLSSIVFVGIVLVIFYYFKDYIFAHLLNTSGKDATLTGRTTLWLAADNLIVQRPWLGIGYNTFWNPGNLEAESLWRTFGIENRSGFNFHNTYREITVHLGFVGLAVFIVFSSLGMISLFMRVMRNPSAPLIFLSAILVSSIIKLPFESFGFGSMQLFGVLTFASIAAGYTTLRR